MNVTENLAVLGRRFMNRARLADDEAENLRDQARRVAEQFPGDEPADERLRRDAVRRVNRDADKAEADAERFRRIAEYASRGYLFMDRQAVADGLFHGLGAEEDQLAWDQAFAAGLLVYESVDEQRLNEAAAS